MTVDFFGGGRGLILFHTTKEIFVLIIFYLLNCSHTHVPIHDVDSDLHGLFLLGNKKFTRATRVNKYLLNATCIDVHII